MAVSISDTWLDAIADAIIAGADRITVCAGAPANIAGITTNKLAQTTLAGGDFTKANGDVSGRKVVTALKADVDITTSGSADHIAIDDGTNMAVFTVTAKTLTSGDKVNIPALTMTVPDPVAV